MTVRTGSKSRGNKKGSQGGRKGGGGSKRVTHAVPSIVDVFATLPDGSEIELRAISSDNVASLRVMLADSVEFCHVTSYSLEHDFHDGPLNDTCMITKLKPCTIDLVHQPYDHESALENVRVLADIVGTTSVFGPPASPVEEGKGNGDLCPPTKLSEFYSFFAAGVEPPLSKVEITSRAPAPGRLLEVAVTGPTGEGMAVTATPEGFLLNGGKAHPTLVDLLKAECPGFAPRYGRLLEAFRARNPFGQLPLGLRANTWLVPRCLEGEEGEGSPLPTEDPALGGGGGGAAGGGVPRDWYGDLSTFCALPGQSEDERAVRDRRVYLAHAHYVDAATRKAAAVAAEGGAAYPTGTPVKEQHLEVTRLPLEQTVTPGGGLGPATPLGREAAVLKGLGASDHTVAADVASLTNAVVYMGGVAVRVRADEGAARCPTGPRPVEEEPMAAHGGAWTLNPASLRARLPAGGAAEAEAGMEALRGVLSRSAAAVRASGGIPPPAPRIRWELAATWVQSLRPAGDSTPAPQGPPHPDLAAALGADVAAGLPAEARGLSPAQCADAVASYHKSAAIPKLLEDFRSLELSPVDGRTLADFMHIRGLNMRDTGRVAEMAGSLAHVKDLCVAELAARGLKRVIRAALAAAQPGAGAAAAAAALSAALGAGHPLSSELWSFLTSYVATRFRYKLSGAEVAGIRRGALLRSCCAKVGLEMRTRSYDFASAHPIEAADIISIVPVTKHSPYTSADGRSLLEASKAALDKGELPEAVSAGASALARLCGVCGPRSRAAAGAYSLLAVALYHAGDFAQAATYQQKALRICERELGLDHPDTMKAYGDLAVFYYRLQHTELSLTYVHRAMFLLEITCGPEHPNTAATFINVAMMEEGVGNVSLALRFLHEALRCNQRLLGWDHVQTAASYHAIAIALSLMDAPAYALSAQHEHTTLGILESKLGPDDLRTRDAAAWLEYFESKALEQSEAARTGAHVPDPSIASKGHLPLEDLMRFIDADAAAEAQRRDRWEVRQKVEASLARPPSAEAGTSESEADAEEEEEDAEVDVVEEVEVRGAEDAKDAAGGGGWGEGVGEDDGGAWEPAVRQRPRAGGRAASPPGGKGREAAGGRGGERDRRRAGGKVGGDARRARLPKAPGQPRATPVPVPVPMPAPAPAAAPASEQARAVVVNGSTGSYAARVSGAKGGAPSVVSVRIDVPKLMDIAREAEAAAAAAAATKQAAKPAAVPAKPASEAAGGAKRGATWGGASVAAPAAPAAEKAVPAAAPAAAPAAGATSWASRVNSAPGATAAAPTPAAAAAAAAAPASRSLDAAAPAFTPGTSKLRPSALAFVPRARASPPAPPPREGVAISEDWQACAAPTSPDTARPPTMAEKLARSLGLLSSSAAAAAPAAPAPAPTGSSGSSDSGDSVPTPTSVLASDGGASTPSPRREANVDGFVVVSQGKRAPLPPSRPGAGREGGRGARQAGKRAGGGGPTGKRGGREPTPIAAAN